MVDIGSITGSFAGYAKSSAFWLVIVVILVIVIFYFYAFMQRRSKLKYNCVEVVYFGNGKVGLNLSKAGTFKSKSMFFGLIDYGQEFVTKTADNRIIQQAKSKYLHDVFGKKGFICMRKSDDPKILVPISKVNFENMELLLSIASADYRDASIRIFNEAVQETKGTWEKLLPYVAIGLCVVLTIINVVVNMQMTNHTTDKVGGMLIAGCQNSQGTNPGAAP